MDCGLRRIPDPDCELGFADSRYVALITIVFSSDFTSHLRDCGFTFSPALPLINSTASQSSNSGCEGRSPRKPKSSVVLTNPTPNNICQKRLTVTRLVSGFDECTSQR